MAGKMPVLLSVATADEVTYLYRLRWSRREYATELANQSTQLTGAISQPQRLFGESASHRFFSAFSTERPAVSQLITADNKKTRGK